MKDRLLVSAIKLLACVAVLITWAGDLAFGAVPRPEVLVVSPNNAHDYMTIGAAIDSIPVGAKRPVIIWIHPGIYHERLIIPANKPPITLIGQNPDNTIIEYSLIAYNKGPNGKPLGMWNTAAVWVKQNRFAAANISFVNDGGQGGGGIHPLEWPGVGHAD